MFGRHPDFGAVALISICSIIGTAQEEELPVLSRSFATVSSPVPSFPEGRFEPSPGETVAFLGGTEIFDLDRYGFLETALQLAMPGHGLRWRNLACQGDTIYHQARPRYFYTKKGDSQPGSIPDHRERTEPGIVFVCFGKTESLEARDSSHDFIVAYAKLLDELAPLTGRVVLVAPTPFFPTGPAASLAEERNKALHLHVELIRGFAGERDFLFVDAFNPFLTDLKPEYSDNGVHLTEAGHRTLAEIVLAQLGVSAPVGEPATVQSLRQAIERKNRLWQQYYRPTNWAFLFGDRQHVPASRDVGNRDERWFVREIDALPGLIAESEADIQRYAGEAAKQ